MYDPYADFVKNTLSNGLEIHSTFWARPWIKVEIVVHSGGREDPVTMPGLAHYVEHMVSKNIPHRTHDSAKHFFETCGGRTEFGSTSYFSTRYMFSVPADITIFREALEIFGSMLIEAKLSEQIENERKIILQEFNGRYPFINKLGWDMKVRKALFNGHRLETWNRPLGRPEGFLSTTEDDLQTFYDKHYVPKNISMAIVGGLTTDEILTELQKSPFGINKNGSRVLIPQTLKSFPVPESQSRIVKMSDHVNFEFDQTEYTANWAFPADFPTQARRVFTQVLSKILSDEVREKRGLAYGIGSDYQNFHDVIEYEVSGRVRPHATSQINDLVQECILMVPQREDLFERKKESLLQECKMTDLSGSALADISADDLASDHRIILMQEVWDGLQQVTHEHMVQATALLRPTHQYTFITCP